MAQYQDQYKYHIDDRHKRNDDLTNVCDTLNSTDQNQRNKAGNDDGCDDDCPGILADARNINNMQGIRIKEIFYRTGNTIDLCDRTDAQKTCQCAK